MEYLVDRGYSVRAFCIYNSLGSYGWLSTISSEKLSSVEFYLGDIRDAQSVQNAVQGCDYVFHLAALIAIPYSYSAPSSYIDTNISGTLNVLQSCRSLSVERLITTSTSEYMVLHNLFLSPRITHLLLNLHMLPQKIGRRPTSP